MSSLREAQRSVSDSFAFYLNDRPTRPQVNERQMSGFHDTGPPQNATPRLAVRAERDSGDVTAPITRSKWPGKAQIRRLLAEYRAMCVAQRLLEIAFWRIEQRKNLLADRLANLRVRPFCEPSPAGKGAR